MTRQLFTEARIFTPEGFVNGNLLVEDGRISRIIPANSGETEKESEGSDTSRICLKGKKIIPGLIDIHIHGAGGGDVSDGSPEGLKAMAAYLAAQGITSFLPTAMTMSFEALEKVCRNVLEACRRYKESSGEPDSGKLEDSRQQENSRERDNSGHQAKILGVRLEGPFLSEKKKGAQDAAWLQLPDFDAFRELYDSTCGIIKLIDIAPELEGALDFTQQASGFVKVSAAHTAADYETGCAFYQAGGSQLTHLFNAMTPLQHRAPGIIAAAAGAEHVFAELISDGIHIHPAMIPLAFRLFPERICLISDALHFLGASSPQAEDTGFLEASSPQAEDAGFLGASFPQDGRAEDPAYRQNAGAERRTVYRPDGMIAGQAVYLPDGTLAGSATSLYQDMLNAVRFGVPEEAAIRAATIHPAKALGLDKEIGSIEAGKAADFIICSESLEREAVYINGKAVQRS